MNDARVSAGTERVFDGKGKLMRRRDVIGLLTTVPFLVLTDCGEMFPSRFRFKMTVEIETPRGLKTGSSVMEMSTALTGVNMPHLNVTETRFKGEAVAVDLPGGTLFALVGGTPGGDDFRGAVINTFAFPRRPEAEKLVALFDTLGQPASLGREVVIHPKDLPKLVRFRDIRDPNTVELVDPDDLAKSFGAGVKLKRIVLTVVDEPVTLGIEKRLNEIGIKPGQGLEASPSGLLTENSTLAQRLGYGDFSRGMKK
jgi:hypothetical protein